MKMVLGSLALWLFLLSLLTTNCASNQYARYLEVSDANLGQPGVPYYIGAVNAVRDIFEDAPPALTSNLPINKKLLCAHITPSSFREDLYLVFKMNETQKLVLAPYGNQIKDQIPGTTSAPLMLLEDVTTNGVKQAVLKNLSGISHYIRQNEDKHVLIEGISTEYGVRPAVTNEELMAPEYFDCQL